MSGWPIATDMMYTPSYVLLSGQQDNIINATDLVKSDQVMDSFGFE
jgi:hypothetical protein